MLTNKDRVGLGMNNTGKKKGRLPKTHVEHKCRICPKEVRTTRHLCWDCLFKIMSADHRRVSEGLARTLCGDWR